jgi:hypothetical protein
MEYRGKQYRVMLGIDSQWKWSVDGIEGFTKSSKAPGHADGVKAPSARSTKLWRRKSNACSVQNESGRQLRRPHFLLRSPTGDITCYLRRAVNSESPCQRG